jgi:hypothetical protein
MRLSQKKGSFTCDLFRKTLKNKPLIKNNLGRANGELSDTVRKRS